MKKILILSCNTGQGHNSAGHAMEEAFARAGAAAEMRDALCFAGRRTSHVVSDGYMELTRRAPKAFGRLYQAGKFISSSRRKSPVYYANRLYAASLGQYIRQSGFDAVVMPHLFPAETLTYLRGHGLKVPAYNICTDYACIPFWEETEPDAFFIPHEALRPEFLGKGVPESRLVVTGIPVSARFNAHMDKPEARRRLGLPERGMALLVMTGSMGFGDIETLIAELAANCPADAAICVLTGHNERLRARLEAVYAADARVRAVPFTTEVPLYMDASDVLLTKPGGLTSTEAAVRNVPLVFTMPIPGCETANANFFSARGMARRAENPREAALCAIELAGDWYARERMLQAQRQEICATAADDIARYVLDHAREKD